MSVPFYFPIIEDMEKLPQKVMKRIIPSGNKVLLYDKMIEIYPGVI